MKFKDILTSFKGNTSLDNNHTHKAYVDKWGNGETSIDNKHKHVINNWKVLNAMDHVHRYLE